MFTGLGVIKKTKGRPEAELENIFTRLDEAFASPEASKSDIVEVLKDYLRNFDHIEKGRNLDQGM